MALGPGDQIGFNPGRRHIPQDWAHSGLLRSVMGGDPLSIWVGTGYWGERGPREEEARV